MSNPLNLLNDDQTASIATALMMSHHGFRRDLARFQTALESVTERDPSRVEALRDEWQRYGSTLQTCWRNSAPCFPRLSSPTTRRPRRLRRPLRSRLGLDPTPVRLVRRFRTAWYPDGSGLRTAPARLQAASAAHRAILPRRGAWEDAALDR
jgi:hypothetical protein